MVFPEFGIASGPNKKGRGDSDSPFGFGAVTWRRGNCLLLLSRIGVSGLGGLLRKKRAYVF